ncbi:MAG TPA: hypothetical protein VH914_01925 [Acidimicrobiia bacterium]|jgi:hypothetical protein|nr:hypothetical protein [Acidimicrobiia bacterium]
MHKLFATVAVGALAAIAVPGVASAKGGPGVTTKGHCSARSESKVKAKTDDGRIETEFEVDQNVNGDTWKVVLRDNGMVVARGKATTAAPSGSFEFRRTIADRSGQDVIRAKAMNLKTGETCKASVSL